MNLAKSVLCFTLVMHLVVAHELAWSWGAEGHRYVNQVAAQHIPADMPHFLRKGIAEITYLGPEPDRWRSLATFALKNAQEPDHFIDLERVAWLDPLPPGRYEFYRKLYEKRAATPVHPDDYLPEHVGLQPYIVAEIYGRLVAAFYQYRQLREQHQPTAAVEHAIVFYAGWLGHYVADGSQPLHTTIDYDGWVGPNPNGYTTEHGIHAQFESTYVAQNITSSDFAPLLHAPQRLADPFADYIDYLKQSNKLVENVYALDKAHAFTGKGSPAGFDFTTHRLAAGSQMLLNLWYTAWLASATFSDRAPGAPTVPHPSPAPR